MALRNILYSIDINKVICKVSDFGLSKIIPQNYNYYESTQNSQTQIPVPVKVLKNYFILFLKNIHIKRIIL